MSTAVASMAPASISTHHTTRDPSPKNTTAMAPSASAPANSSPSRMSTTSQDVPSKATPEHRGPSPQSQTSTGPRILVKKEPPSSPRIQSRPRPRKLDLSTSLPSSSGLQVRNPGGPMTAREGITMQNVGLACLSPGFQTHDPVMREQLQRSMSVREQQRSIIEARLHKSAKDDGPEGVKPSESKFMAVPPKSSTKRRPPAGLSIVPPSASQFANERVIQSAPLNQTFTGRYQPQPLTRHVVNQSPTLGSTSHMHHVPATQTNNRLPPIADVFGSETLGGRDRDRERERERERPSMYAHASSSNSSQSNMAPLPSPGLPGPSSQTPRRPREYRSAEEAVQEMSGGREDLLPRIVHYGGHQPPTPPSPHHGPASQKTAPQITEPAPSAPHAPPPMYLPESTARRRPRSEYESDNGSPPLGHGPDPHGRPNPATTMGPNSTFPGPFGAGRDSPETQRRKKEEFLGLCARAWDLFHS
ncbi:hypothetical protein POX_c04683 [Penicillium oxalicum]|uniref:Uncharacterized protein n=1 Tax=Penicillium oxalicum (strain 114-2 / CGMCC 5302) TaxID=933388 RepID=S7ZBZ0_PENO1|nr:hypothetical protein POX_c04683 [Penicillium oxalicum]EPS26216.1 hypothetical protein PDE_01152 [Penicillium oxalicum 114-2]KAI2791804.1 hypothetical protein POX_c04683 [Penicillium oxalicum]